jgi:hypothetical protein
MARDRNDRGQVKAAVIPLKLDIGGPHFVNRGLWHCRSLTAGIVHEIQGA